MKKVFLFSLLCIIISCTSKKEQALIDAASSHVDQSSWPIYVSKSVQNPGMYDVYRCTYCGEIQSQDKVVEALWLSTRDEMVKHEKESVQFLYLKAQLDSLAEEMQKINKLKNEFLANEQKEADKQKKKS